MGRISVANDLSNLDKPEDFQRFASQLLKQIVQVVAGNLTFGENLKSALVDVTFTAGATATTVKHGLGYVPTGYIQVGASTDLLVYGLSGSGWDGDVISLQANKAGTAKLIVF